jgi:T5SS/PEP-CTERM-associated repeat protein
MNVQNGGTVTAPSTIVGYSGAPNSTLRISGAGTTYNATTQFIVGRATGGALVLDDGGELIIGGGSLPLQVATMPGSDGYVYIGLHNPAGKLTASAVQFGFGKGHGYWGRN